MPKSTKQEQAKKDAVMEQALQACCEVPLEIMCKSCEAIDTHQEFAIMGAAIAFSDVGCGVISCKAALQMASFNVFINTKSMEDRQLAQPYNQKTNSMLEKYAPLAM